MSLVAGCTDLANVTVELADALDLPMSDKEGNLACVLQIYSYVTELDRALMELRRVLKTSG